MISSAEQQQHLVVEDSDHRMVEHNEVPIMAKPGEANTYFPSYTTNHPVERDSDEDETEEVDDEENGGRFFDPLFEFKEQDRLLPYANIERIMKKTVEMFNKSAKISKEAKECMQECVTEFICFVTGEASDLCVDEKRKTVAGEDVLNALEKLGFENYCGALKECLTKHRESIKNDKKGGSGSNKNKKKPPKGGKNSNNKDTSIQ